MSRRRRDSWSVPALPGVLRANARECERFAATQEMAAQTWGDEPRRLSLARAFRHEAQLCRDETLPLFWVTEPMAQVALDASQDLPVLSPAMAPCPRGFLGVAGGLPPLPPPNPHGWYALTGEQITEGITPTALLWETTTAHFRVTIFAHESVMPPGIRFSRGPLQELVGLRFPRASTGDWATLIPGDTTALRPEDPGLRVDGTHLSVMAWACATWHLMMTPTVATRRTLDPRTGGPTPPTNTTNTPTRQHRWVVRGHWVHQPHGPGHSLRRLQWRESHIKGPEGAPLLRSRPINIWRR